MNHLVTVDRRHPNFQSYLRGTFSRTQRALPVRSLNIRSDSETVTFQLVEVAEIKKPSWIVVWLKALRPRGFLTVLVPVLFALAPRSPRALDPDLPWLAFVALMALHAAVLLRNDVQDHLTGYDRVRSDRGSRAIQNGWLTVAQVENASRIFLGVALLFAAPVFFARPSTLIVGAVGAVLGGLTFFRREKSFRDLIASPLVVFLMGGPLLALGLDLALTGQWHPVNLGAGAVWGWAILFPVHLRDLENLIGESQAGRGSIVGRAGFDRAIKLIDAWWLVTLAGFAVLHYYDVDSLVIWMGILLLATASFRFSLRLRSLASPAGSGAALVRREGEMLFAGFIVLWVVESLCRIPA